MTETDEQMVPLSEVNAAIDRVSRQIQEEDKLGATREMMVDGTAARIKSAINDLALPSESPLVYCPNCGNKLTKTTNDSGAWVECPTHGQVFVEFHK